MTDAMTYSTTPRPKPRPAGQPVTTSRRALAAAMVAAPILLLAATAAVPAAVGERHGADRAKALHVLMRAAPDRSSIPLAVVLLGLGLGLLTPAAIGLTALAGGRRLAVAGATLVTVGAPMGAATNAVTGLTIYRLTDPGLSRNTAADVLAYNSGAAGLTIFALYLLLLLGMILLGIALWRSRALTWWQAALVGPGAVLGFAGPEGPAGALFTVPLAVGMTMAARKLSRR
jgi:hypothetical protein